MFYICLLEKATPF